MKETESQIVSAICDYLAAKRHFFWRQNTTPAVQKSVDGWAFRRMPKHAKKGVPDIIVIHQARFVGLEVKRSDGRLSADQQEFQRGCEAQGGHYHLVRSLDDVQRIGL